MKQTLKKLTGIFMLFVLMLSICACGSSKEAEVNQTEEDLKSSCEAFVTGLAGYTDEELEYLETSGTDFYIAAAEAWEENRDALGALVSIAEETTVAKTSGVYSVVVGAKFENKSADITITFLTDTLMPTSITFEPETTMGEKMSQAAMNTVIGIGTVFVVLIFLSFLISLFRFIGAPGKKKAEAAKPEVAAPVQETVEEVDDTELIAVIAAAIAAYEGTSTDGFVVRSVKKVRKNNWKRA